MPVAAAAAKLLQLCPTLCDPTDGSPPGSSVPGILQTRTEHQCLEFMLMKSGEGSIFISFLISMLKNLILHLNPL